jgi:DNA-binding GntR family transcriptional regulator
MTSVPSVAADAFADDAANGDWQTVRPRTMVDHAVDAIMAGAARGFILPGDRIVESELAKVLGMSRVPIREALRILESQGVVTSAPYKGIRLMTVSRERLDHVLEVRVSLETIAARRAMKAGRNGPAGIARLSSDVAELELMAMRGDAYGFANADAAFHRTLCALGGNEVLSTLWESLARQLTIIFGLSTLGKGMAKIVEEHRILVSVFASGDGGAMRRALEDHILIQVGAVDFDRIIAERRNRRPGTV